MVCRKLLDLYEGEATRLLGEYPRIKIIEEDTKNELISESIESMTLKRNRFPLAQGLMTSR